MPGAILRRWSDRRQRIFWWRFAEYGTTWDMKIFLRPFFVTKKKLLYGNARNVNKSRNMSSRTFLWSCHSPIRNSTQCKQKTVLLRAAHIWKIILANFETKFKKLFLLLESSKENVRGGVHFILTWHCCLQLFRNEFHCNRLSEFPHLF